MQVQESGGAWQGRGSGRDRGGQTGGRRVGVLTGSTGGEMVTGEERGARDKEDF